MDRYVVPLQEISAGHFQEFGGKAANLGELIKAGFNVPSGFCVKSDAFFFLLDFNNLSERISQITNTINFDDLTGLSEKAGIISSLIFNARIPKNLEEDIISNYEAIEKLRGEETLVAIRSSCAVKGTSISSMPGQMDTFHYIRGSEQVLQSIRKCWASVWTSRATITRHQKKIGHFDALIAPVVQEMVDPDVAGVMFTINPMTSSKDELVIESNWGLGETVVSGIAVSDFYVVDKATLSTKDAKIARKLQMIVHDRDKGARSEPVPVPAEKQVIPTLTTEELRQLAMTGLLIEAHYGIPQDIEWAYSGGRLFILQTRTARGYQA